MTCVISLMRVVIVLLGLALACPAVAQEAPASNVVVPSQARFHAAENVDGPGFFWVDTMTGCLWLLDSAAMRWTYCGAPETAVPSAIGTYVPRKHQAGPGVFILNTTSGEGWWTDGAAWRVIGIPLVIGASDQE